jgi:acetyl-CoA carboxylase biotin carboxylase subunit
MQQHRPGLAADGTQSPRSQALVLGPRAVARLVARGLEAEGYRTVLEEGRTPLPGAPAALDALHELLARFAGTAGPAAPGISHCVHPGVSPWAERPELPLLAQEHGLAVIAPPVRAVSLFANRLNFLAEADRLGIPHLVVGFDPIHSVREVERLLGQGRRGLPLVLKSVRRGAGFGLNVMHGPDDVERRLPLWLEQLRRAHGEVILFAERYVEGARHAILPFARFRDGHTEFFSVVDASLQSRFRKIAEFCPAPGLDAEAVASMHAAARRILDRCDYVGTGALEFLADGGRAFLLEGVPRLNTAFPLWERVEGTSAVAWQLAALGGTGPSRGSARALPPRKASPEWRSGLAVRLYAEDPLLQLPQPGLAREISPKREWRLPGAAAELSLSVDAGEEIGPSGDGLFGLLFAGGQERGQAVTVARGALEETWIAGSLQTNERFVAELLAHPWVREGLFHASFVDEEFVPEIRPEPELAGILAALGALLAGRDPGHPPAARWCVGDQWVKPGTAAALAWESGPEGWTHAGRPGLSGSIRLPGGRVAQVSAFPMPSTGRWQIRVGAWSLPVRGAGPSGSGSVPARRRLHSLVNGRVHAILYREGAAVPAHEPLVVVESLGVLVPHALPVETRVTAWKASAEQPVHTGQELAEFETSAGGSTGLS